MKKYIIYLRGFPKTNTLIKANDFYLTENNKMVYFVENHNNIIAAFNLEKIVGFKRL